MARWRTVGRNEPEPGTRCFVYISADPNREISNDMFDIVFYRKEEGTSPYWEDQNTEKYHTDSSDFWMEALVPHYTQKKIRSVKKTNTFTRLRDLLSKSPSLLTKIEEYKPEWKYIAVKYYFEEQTPSEIAKTIDAENAENVVKYALAGIQKFIYSTIVEERLVTS